MLIATILKYLFVAGLGLEVVLIVRALFNLARDKAHENVTAVKE